MKKPQWMEIERGRVGMWIAVGPLLLVAGLVTALVRLGSFGFFTALFTVIAFLLSWKGKLPGAILGVVTAGVAFLCSRHMVGVASWWHIVFVCTLLLSFVVTALSLSVGEEQLVENEEQLLAKLEEMEEQNAATMKAHLQERIAQEQKNEERNLDIKRLIEEVDSYKRLVAASQEDAEKFYNHNRELQEELFQVEKEQTSSDELLDRLAALEKKNHALQQELNHYRVAHYQKDLLSAHYKEQAVAALEEMPTEKRQELYDLAALRENAKSAYAQVIADYKEVTEKMASEESAELRDNLLAKREELSHLRERIFRLEGEMLKTQQQFAGGISAEEGYLAIADGECHRLEEENRFLLDLLARKKKEV